MNGYLFFEHRWHELPEIALDKILREYCVDPQAGALLHLSNQNGIYLASARLA